MARTTDKLKEGWLETYIQGRLSGPILIAVVAIVAAVAAGLVWLAESFSPVRLALVILTAAGLVWLVLRPGVRAVARQTLAQCIRMRIALAFIVMMALVLTLLPSVMKGDGTLAGSIRTYLSYGVGLTGGLLSLLTVLLAVAVVSWDIRERTIFLLSVKPVRRWEYLLGRWLGVMALSTALLGIAGGGVYIFLQYLRDGQAVNEVDRRTVETEIFTARYRIRPRLPDYETAIRRRIATMRDNGTFDETVEAIMAGRNIPREEAEQQLLRQLQGDARTASELIPRGERKAYRFPGVDVVGETVTAEGKVDVADVAGGRFRLSAPSRLTARLVYGGPVVVQGYRGRVTHLQGGTLDVEFPAPVMTHVELNSLKAGDPVEVKAEPTVQFSYKVTATTGEQLGTVGRVLELYLGVPRENTGPDPDPREIDFEGMYIDAGTAPLKQMTTATLPVYGPAAESESELAVVYQNVSPIEGEQLRPVRILYEDVSLLYRVGGFEANFFRAMLLMLFQLAFLAALGVFFGSFLSFPVGSFACMVLLVNGWMLSWLAEHVSGQAGVVGGMGALTVTVLGFILPDFGQTSPAQSLVNGLAITWPTVAGVGAMTVAIRTGLVLLGGSLIFQSRELAGSEH
jgi:hypothetical protein